MDTRFEHNTKLLKYKDFDSLFEQTRYVYYDLKSTGYDYTENGLLNKMTSKYLWRNTKFANFLNSIDKLLIFMVNRVKYIQFFTNYAIKSSEQKINL